MKMVKTILFYTLAGFVFLCFTLSSQQTDINKIILPGVVKVEDNLFVDQQVITQLDWLEYITWLKEAYGKESKNYHMALPATEGWSEKGLSRAKESTPISEITLRQAELYSKWRSDRVFEMILLKEKVLPANKESRMKPPFTIENYYNGVYKGVKTDYPNYPKYRLPTFAEAESIQGQSKRFLPGLKPNWSADGDVLGPDGFRNVCQWVEWESN